MAKKLKTDKNFTPYPASPGDEFFPNGIFEFNITRIIEFIQTNHDSISLEEVAVSKILKAPFVDESYMDSVDLSNPVIMAEIAPGLYNLIDGNHRVEKSRRLGIDSIRAYKLNVDQHMRFLTSQYAYEAYINYWNDKIKCEAKRIKTLIKYETDMLLPKVETFFEKKKAPVLIKKISNGYSIYMEEDNTPVARLKLTGTKGQVEVLWWGHKRKWDSIGDFGGIILSLDKALKYVMDDPMGCLWPY